MKKRLHLTSFQTIALCTSLFLISFSAYAGQDVSISTSVGNNVYGNGTLPDGSAPGNAIINLTKSQNNNSVYVYDGALVTGNVYGGAVSTSGNASVSGNSVIINGGSISGSIHGGYSQSSSGDAISSKNTVIINGGSANGSIYGGYAESYVPGASVESSGNSVTITGGSINGFVAGGAVASHDPLRRAINNTITISGNPFFSPTSSLNGGVAPGLVNPQTDTFTGNRLNVWDYSGSSLQRVQQFQYFNFLLSADAVSNAPPPLVITGNLKIDNSVASGYPITAYSTVEAVNFKGGGRVQQPGETFPLISAGSISGTIANDGQVLAGKKGATLAYDIRVDQVGNEIAATILGLRLHPDSKAVSKGHLAGAALANQSVDLIAGMGMRNAIKACGDRIGVAGFSALSAGSSRYDVGSDMDISGLSLVAGLALCQQYSIGKLTLGSFFEAGSSSYSTSGSSATATMEGDGNARYMGGGVLSRLDFSKTGPGHFYTEGSARMGQMTNHYSGSTMRDGIGRGGGFDTYSPYYGIHVGGGYIWAIQDNLSLDFYGKYFWTRVEGQSVTLNTGDPVSFEDINSNHARLGGRATYRVNEYISPFAGLAYEREFSGKAKATTYNYSVKTHSLNGDTGIGELGLSFQPSQTIPFTLDLSLQGYTGVREGLTGSMQLRFDF